MDLSKITKYLVISGSHAYGMATSESDIDVRGWGIPPKEYFLSYHKHFEQSERAWLPDEFPWLRDASNKSLEAWAAINKVVLKNEPIDCTIFDIRKFVKLAADCNPNIIELLYVCPEDILVFDMVAEPLFLARDLFLSARARYSYSGYAISQLKRIKTHRKWLLNPPVAKPERADFNLPSCSLIPPEQRGAYDALVNKQARLWLLEELEIDATIVAEVQDGLVEMLSLNDRNELKQKAEAAAALMYEISDNIIEIMDKEKKYRARLNEWNQYQDWLRNRNPARAELEKKYTFDSKHASHLYRLLLQGLEILTKGTLTLKDKAQSELLTGIRCGALSYDELIESSEKMHKQLDEIYKAKTYVVPHTPNVNAIDVITIRCIEKSL